MLRSQAGIAGKSRKQGGRGAPDGRRSGRQVEARIRRVPGKQKLFPETLTETGKRREGEKGFSSPSSMSPSDASVSHWSNPARTIDETQETQPVSQFPHDKEQSKSKKKNDSERTGSRTAWIFLNKVTDQPGKQFQDGCEGQR